MEWVRNNVAKHFRSDITVTFFRHGKSERYEEVGKGTYEEALTQEGEDRVKQAAILLANEIKQKNEIALIWSSPRKRTLQTAHILSHTFEEYGTYVLYRRGVVGGKKFKPCDLLQSPNLTDDFWDKKPDGESFVPLWRELSDKNMLPEGTEHYNSHELRLRSMLDYSRRIAVVMKKFPKCPRIRLIAVCHFETVTPLLQQAYGGEAGVVRGQGLEKAGYMDIGLEIKDKGNVKSILMVQFHSRRNDEENEHSKEYLLFDKQNELTKLI